MENIDLPKEFPEEIQMFAILKRTIEKSWKVQMDFNDIELWLENFSGQVFDKDVERRLALWMLCNFTFYNQEEVRYLCNISFKKLIHQIMLDNRFKQEEDLEAYFENIAFTSIGGASESGGFLLYHFRQEAQLGLDKFIFPIVKTSCETIVCIDDVIISGTTASTFLEEHQEEYKDKKIYYVSLITTEAAVEKLANLGIKVIYCEKFDSRNKTFSSNSLTFYKFPELRIKAKEMAKYYGKKLEPQNPLGFKKGEYSFGLYHNVPNNSLPIFWSDNNNWNPIFIRKKKYRYAKREYSYFI